MHESIRWRARRRQLLSAALASGTLRGAGLAALIRSALAAEDPTRASTVRTLEGELRINDRPAQPGASVQAGDKIETGARSRAVVVIGADAFLLRENTRVESAGAQLAIGALRLITGKLLSVFGPGAKQLQTPSATIGIRGTGAYLEADPQRTYFCLCYGSAEVSAGARNESITTRHHESPRYITRDSYGGFDISLADMGNHTDAELIMLEALVGRVPPFVTPVPQR
jgi:hypothetical protein